MSTTPPVGPHPAPARPQVPPRLPAIAAVLLTLTGGRGTSWTQQTIRTRLATFLAAEHAALRRDAAMQTDREAGG
jgi:hypothetical protein